jgi:hypothetical protein
VRRQGGHGRRLAHLPVPLASTPPRRWIRSR